MDKVRIAKVRNHILDLYKPNEPVSSLVILEILAIMAAEIPKAASSSASQEPGEDPPSGA